MGAGFGLSTPLINNITVERSTPAKKAANFSYYSMATFGGQFLSSLTASIAVGKNAFAMAATLAFFTFLITFVKFDRNVCSDEAACSEAESAYKAN